MTKLEIVQLAKKTKDVAKTAKAIRETYATFEGLNDEATCLEFGTHMLDKHTRGEFYLTLFK